MKLRWGIFATGRIAEKFARDILIDPAGRGVTDVTHDLVGIASSTSKTVAKHFAKRVNAPSTCLVYDSYLGLVHNPEVDIVYIATPHSHHFQNAMLALQAKKHVLCEKPLTVNAEQAKKLFALAAQKRLFFMEGMWTRFQPISLEIGHLLRIGTIGNVIRVMADNSLGLDPWTEFSPEDRLLRKNLAGGALLDLGVYSISWVLQALSKEQRFPMKICSIVSKYIVTGVDNTTSIAMQFPACSAGGADVIAIANASLSAADDYDGQTPVVRIQGEKGEIQVFGPPWRPSEASLVMRKQGSGATGSRTRIIEHSIPDGEHGLGFEADEAARCIRDGKLESSYMPWTESLTAMQIMDKVREENGLCFPREIESLDYPVNLPSVGASE